MKTGCDSKFCFLYKSRLAHQLNHICCRGRIVDIFFFLSHLFCLFSRASILTSNPNTPSNNTSARLTPPVRQGTYQEHRQQPELQPLSKVTQWPSEDLHRVFSFSASTKSVFVFIRSFSFLSSSRNILNKARGILLIVWIQFKDRFICLPWK